MGYLYRSKTNRKVGYHNSVSEKLGGDVEGRLVNSVENNIRCLLQLHFFICATVATKGGRRSRLRMYQKMTELVTESVTHVALLPCWSDGRRQRELGWKLQRQLIITHEGT